MDRERDPRQYVATADDPFFIPTFGKRFIFADVDRTTYPVFDDLVLLLAERRRTGDDFLSFMDLVARRCRQSRMHVVLDNLNTHKDTTQGAYLSEWNETHGGRFDFHYIPTHVSWLNQVELWFSILSRRVLRHGDFHGPAELIETMERFIERCYDEEAKPFRWTYEGRPLVSL